MGMPMPGPRQDILPFMLPHLRDIERSVEKANDRRLSQFDRFNATRDVIKTLNLTSQVGGDFAARLSEVRIRPTGRTYNHDARFYERLGLEIHTSLQSVGLEWPPPMQAPPPTVARDLVDLYRLAQQIYGDPDWDGLPISSSFAAMEQKTAYLLRKLQYNQGLYYADSVIAMVRSTPDARRSRAGKIVGGLALAIGIIQGPGAVHNLPQDVAELSEDMVYASKRIQDGVNVVLTDMLREIEDGWAEARF